MDGQHGVVLFDGVCNLCHGSVQFIIRRDPKGRFRFTSLQSEAAKPYMDAHGLRADYLDSVVLIEDGVCYRDSTAALRIARRLRRLWPVMYVFILVPRFIRDGVYHWVGRNRYRWFGKREDACWVPTPELRGRFL
jgi:predicted DCC family thiol-disulfide oxidoreductase YuxK